MQDITGHVTLLDNFRNRNVHNPFEQFATWFLFGFSFPPCAYPKAKRALLHQAKWTILQGRENWHRLKSSHSRYQRCTNMVASAIFSLTLKKRAAQPGKTCIRSDWASTGHPNSETLVINGE
jgi:hypothetical protein